MKKIAIHNQRTWSSQHIQDNIEAKQPTKIYRAAKKWGVEKGKRSESVKRCMFLWWNRKGYSCLQLFAWNGYDMRCE